MILHIGNDRIFTDVGKLYESFFVCGIKLRIAGGERFHRDGFAFHYVPQARQMPLAPKLPLIDPTSVSSAKFNLSSRRFFLRASWMILSSIAS